MFLQKNCHHDIVTYNNRNCFCHSFFKKQLLIIVREGFNKKIKKIGGIFHGGVTPPPPPSVENYLGNSPLRGKLFRKLPFLWKII